MPDAVAPHSQPTGTGDAPRPPVPVAIVGAGPVGLAMAVDLATRGVASVVLDEDDTVATGSRAICWAKRTLEIFDRLGIGERVVEKGVTWKLGRVFHGDREIDTIDLLPEDGHRRPAFVNLQQPYVETYLIQRAADFPDLIDVRWRHRLAGIESRTDGIVLDLDTPAGPARLEAAWLVAADGARSTVRRCLGLAFEGTRFDEQFLIADLRVGRDGPSERRFWFLPTFDPAESVLLHRQPDDVVRIDFQLGPEADAEREREPERVLARARRVLGEGVDMELVWSSVYRFRCARTERFVHGRAVLVGDSAHVVSPFGARGGNGGIQDVDNLAWKLALVCRGEAPEALVASYDDERGRGADENIRHSSRTTRFMTPKSAVERAFRDAVLGLAAEHGFARRLVNGGRLSKPCSLDGLPLQTQDGAGGLDGPMVPGSPCLDAPVLDGTGRPAWLLDRLGAGFTALVFAGLDGEIPDGLSRMPAGIDPLLVLPAGSRPPTAAAAFSVVDESGLVAARYGGRPGSAYLIRPDQHVAARWGTWDAGAVAAARDRAIGRADAREAA